MTDTGFLVFIDNFFCLFCCSYVWSIVKQAEGETCVYTLVVSELHMNGARGEVTCIPLLQPASFACSEPCWEARWMGHWSITIQFMPSNVCTSQVALCPLFACLVLASLWFPIKHAGSDLHLIWIGLEALARSRPDSATLTCFQTKSIWSKHDTVSPNQDGYAQYNLGQLWENATEFGSRKLLVGWLLSAKSIPGDSCALACFWTKCIWPKPDLGQFNPLWSGPSLEGQNRMGCRKPDLAYTTGLILAACWL